MHAFVFKKKKSKNLIFIGYRLQYKPVQYHAYLILGSAAPPCPTLFFPPSSLLHYLLQWSICCFPIFHVQLILRPQCVSVWFSQLEAGRGGFGAAFCVCVGGLVWLALGCGVCVYVFFGEVKESQSKCWLPVAALWQLCICVCVYMCVRLLLPGPLEFSLRSCRLWIPVRAFSSNKIPARSSSCWWERARGQRGFRFFVLFPVMWQQVWTGMQSTVNHCHCCWVNLAAEKWLHADSSALILPQTEG